jgi:hypothetical protein
VIVMTGVLRVPRSRGALNGTLLVLLGAWGGLIAFIGPYFHYAYTPDKAWTYTTGRLWLEIVPAVGAVLGGLILGTSASRPSAIFGAWLAALSGAWFALGGLFSTLWWSIGGTGQPVGDKLHRVVEQIGFFTGLGVVIVFLAAVALGRLTVIGARERLAAEAPAVEQVPEEEVTQPARTRTAVPDSRLDDTRTDDTRVDDTRVDGDTVPETVTPPNSEVEETHVAGTRIGDPSV